MQVETMGFLCSDKRKCLEFAGTPAARMKKVPTVEVKNRSRQLTSLFESFTPYEKLEGRVERVWVTDTASDGIHLVRLSTRLYLSALYT